MDALWLAGNAVPKGSGEQGLQKLLETNLQGAVSQEQRQWYIETIWRSGYSPDDISPEEQQKFWKQTREYVQAIRNSVGKLRKVLFLLMFPTLTLVYYLMKKEQNVLLFFLFFSKKCGKISSECFADGWDIAKMVNLIRMEDIMYENEIQSIAARESDAEIYAGLLQLTKDIAKQKGQIQGKKKLYYISAEFLIGKLLSNNLINLGIYDQVANALKEHGKSLTQIEEIENEPSLGNGGLGRLAACFLDSIATLGLPGDGVGLNYHLGLFQQKFENNLQKETPNPWITDPSVLRRTNVSYPVIFGGQTVQSVMYEIDVTGYDNQCNTLKLFDLDTVDESIVEGDGINFDKEDIRRNLTLFLYPDDSDYQGQLLRIYQQYFMVSNAAQLIIDEAVAKGSNIHDLADYAVVQINDTHPTMVIPELIRLLLLRDINIDEAIDIVSKMCAYTNHTILAEALETWPIWYLEKVVPQLIPVIKMLDVKAKEKYGDERVAIIDKDQRVHMAHIDIHYGFSVNGVAALHTEILEKSELKPFKDIYPNKFNNKTNGITFRRWLLHCNHELTSLITDMIGEGYKKDASGIGKPAEICR